MALTPPVSAISGTRGRLSSSSRARAMRRAVAVEPVKATSITRGSETRALPTSGPPGSRCEHARRNAGLVRQPHGGGGDQRSLRRGLGDHGVARRQAGGDLAEEDGQREVPRRDAGDHPPRGQPQLVGLSRRSRQAHRPGQAARLGRVVAAEIGRLPHLAQGVGQGLAGFSHGERHQVRRGRVRAGRRAAPAPAPAPRRRDPPRRAEARGRR